MTDNREDNFVHPDHGCHVTTSWSIATECTLTSAFHSYWSRVFPPVYDCPVFFFSLTFSTHVNWPHIFQSRVSHPLYDHSGFSSAAFSVLRVNKDGLKCGNLLSVFANRVFHIQQFAKYVRLWRYTTTVQHRIPPTWRRQLAQTECITITPCIVFGPIHIN